MQVFSENYRIKRIYSKIVNGDLLIPHYQRQYAWDNAKIELFLDSLNKGIFIGVFQFRRIFFDYNERYEIIDGLHRIRTIFNILLGKGIYFNFDTCKFTLNPNDFDYSKFAEFDYVIQIIKEDGSLDIERSMILNRFYTEIRDIELVSVIYEGTDDEIQLAFDRINQAGVAFTPEFTLVQSETKFEL